MKVAVIGGGPAGMMAAIAASEQQADVTLFEKNEKLGKKMYISGKGRCNLTNDCLPKDFLQNIATNAKFATNCLYKFSPADTMDFCEQNGLKLKVERGDRVFPASDKSSDVIKLFADVARRNGVKIRLNEQITDIVYRENVFYLHTIADIVPFDRVIIATGGVSYPSTGSSGDGYGFAKSLSHTVVDPKAALCRILCKNTKSLEGLSLKNVNVSLVCDGKTVASEFGEMLFTDDGVSGPAVLTLSSLINKRNYANAQIVVDLKPALDEQTLHARVLRDFSERMNKDFCNSLDALLPKRICDVVVRQSGISPYKKVNQITAAERARLVHALKNLAFPFAGLGEIETAIVTSGGVNVSEVNPSTMQSKLARGLFFAGEVIDVDCFTGGFNIQFALSSGYVAGTNAAKIED